MAERKAKWQNDYIARTYDRINLTVPKGKKDTIQAHAETQGESVNGFINRAIDQQMERDKGGTPAETARQAPGAAQGAGVVSLPSETIKAAQQAAEAVGEELPEFVTRAIDTQAQRDRLLRGMKPKQKAPGGTPET